MSATPGPLYTSTASLNFTRPCTLCGGEISVVNGQRQPHRCRIDIDAQRAQA